MDQNVTRVASKIRDLLGLIRARGPGLPTVLLWLFAHAFALSHALAGGQSLPTSAELAASFAFPLILVAWVMSDAQTRRLKLCYDYESFLFFAWPVLLPVYLFQTRGIRAFVTLFCFVGIWLTAFVVTVLIAAALE